MANTTDHEVTCVVVATGDAAVAIIIVATSSYYGLVSQSTVKYGPLQQMF